MTYYVYHVWHGVEPALFGPFKTEKERDSKAAEIFGEDSELDNEIFWIDVWSTTSLETGAYSAKYLNEILLEKA